MYSLLLLLLYSSPTVWMKRPEIRSRSASPIYGGTKSPTHKGMGSPVDGAWSPISREQCALLETAWRTGETSIKIAEEDVSSVCYTTCIQISYLKYKYLYPCIYMCDMLLDNHSLCYSACFCIPIV